MGVRLKEHLIIFIVVAAVVHLFTAYIEGSLNPMSFSKDMRETQVIMLIFIEFVSHFAWFNRHKILEN